MSKKYLGRKKGFALILTLSLISFVFLLVITLVNQVRLEFSFTDARQNQILARANARMGMMIAIGEIQKHLGPDMRVSATADIYDERVESLIPLTANTYVQTEVDQSIDSFDLNGNGRGDDKLPDGQRMWTGVWKDRGVGSSKNLEDDRMTNPLPFNGDDAISLTDSWDVDSTYDHHPAIEMAWLVSGNEGKKLAVLDSRGKVTEHIEVPDGRPLTSDQNRLIPINAGYEYGTDENAWQDHKNVVLYNTKLDYYHPYLELPDPDENDSVTWLLNQPVAEEVHTRIKDVKSKGLFDVDSFRVKVRKTALHSDQKVDKDWENRDGAYAFWVGDEGVKAKIDFNQSYPLVDESILTAAPSPNLDGGSYEMDGISTSRGKLLSSSGLGLLDDKIAGELHWDDFRALHYHSLTTHSFGVLSDLRTGGLKRDLSLAFSNFAPGKTPPSVIEDDFANNYLFRERITYKKNLPLFGDSKYRNLWLLGNDALIDDDDTLLAGPPWSVLEDFHNLYKTSPESLELEAPNQFPRIFGDNSVIFEGRPQSPSNSFDRTNDATLYFNSWDDSQRIHRPEPKNHTLSPIMTKIRMAICPVIEPGSDNLSIAILPAVTLWNPYDKPLELNNLFIDIPSYITYQAHPVDLKEYDLYRKWWMALYERDNASFRTDLADNFKDYLTPDPALLTIYSINEPGAYPNYFYLKPNDEPRLDYDFYYRETVMSPLDPKIIKKQWENGIPPHSLYGINFSENTFYHENSDVSQPVYADYQPRFKFFSKESDYSRTANSLRLRIMSRDYATPSDTLLPGEVVNFAAFRTRNQGLNSPTLGEGDTLIVRICRQYNLPEPVFERGSLWTHDFTSPTGLYRVYSKINGVYGMPADAMEKLNYDRASQGFSYGEKPTGYSDVDCITMYQGNHLSEYDPTQSNSPKVITRFSHWQAPENARSVETSVDFLEENFNNLGSSMLPGFGWEVGVQLPGHSEVEQILLNDFNFRTLVHSNQHGKRVWQRNEKFTYSPSTSNGYPDSYKAGYDASTSKLYQGKTFQFPTAVPHFYTLNPSFPYDENDLSNTVGETWHGTLNSQSNPDIRASTTMRMDISISVSEQQDLLKEDMNPHRGAKIPVADISTSSIGFFSHTSDDDRNDSSKSPYNNHFKNSDAAVLFETPGNRVLSLMQYRHANLNNYLHGPNYALGNSYATIQVARHRSWTRINHVYEEPTNKWGMGSLEDNAEMEEAAIKWYEEFYKTRFPTPPWPSEKWSQERRNDKKDNFIDWDDIEPSEGYGPWRSSFGASSHQNIAYDHSYYLNRGLLDGYFLTGSENSNDYRSPTQLSSGSLFSPFLWEWEDNSDNNSTQSFNPRNHDNAFGNSRLTAFLRNSEWGNTSYGEKSLNQQASSARDQALRYQSVAGDLLVEGAFNINSTSVDAWIAQLSSLRGIKVKSGNVSNTEIPVPRFTSEPSSSNNWNMLRKLDDQEISRLAIEMVKQVKLRGPFLSFSDFVNRRLCSGPLEEGSTMNFAKLGFENWPAENIDTISGLRGAVQSAIGESGLNNPLEAEASSGWVNVLPGEFPEIPEKRWSGAKFYDSSFGLMAASKQQYLDPNNDLNRSIGLAETEKDFTVNVPDVNGDGTRDAIHDHRIIYPGSEFGDAQENILAVEGLATGAGKPGWIMQADLLSSLAPSLTARSDTFVIRVLGETNAKIKAKSWIEVVVQRTPDYVKADVDAPHHRPHEPFMDENLNGYWDEATDEPWTNLNYNGVEYPDLPGNKDSLYRDGMPSDLSLNLDSQEDDPSSTKGISIFGINQRFGRKFKIVSFRWLREQDV